MPAEHAGRCSCPERPLPQIIAGMQRASDDGCNVISLSLGMGIGWLEATPSQILLDYLVNVEKRHIFNANGNEGSEGKYRTAEPCRYSPVIDRDSCRRLLLCRSRSIPRRQCNWLSVSRCCDDLEADPSDRRMRAQ